MIDPFAGSGTTGDVAAELGRNAVLIELNPVYVAMQENRDAISDALDASAANDAADEAGPEPGCLF